MIFHHPGKPTWYKKVIYLFLFILLGLMLSLIVHALVEMSYLYYASVRDKIVTFYGGCALPKTLQAGIWLIGFIIGYFQGQFWYRKMYVERFWTGKTWLQIFGIVFTKKFWL